MARSKDLGARSADNVVTTGPWAQRDSYIAETAVTIDRLTAKIERLERREEALNAKVAELVEHAQQAGRFQALAESLRNSRDYKLDETVRLVRELRGRIDAIEGPRAGYATLVHKSLSEINVKLIELSAANSPRLKARSWLPARSGMAISLLAVGIVASVVVNVI